MILRFVAIGIILVVGAIKSGPQGFGVEELYGDWSKFPIITGSYIWVPIIIRALYTFLPFWEQ